MADKTVDGENIIYFFFNNLQNNLDEEDDFSKRLIEKLLIDLSVWIPVDSYKALPIMLPYVVRDASCRIKREGMDRDEWGTANDEGFLRDDNSLVKSIVKSFRINSPKIKNYKNAKIGTGFVASHIWRELKIGKGITLASTFHMTNTFIPNLVWLPKQISKLTDREGSYAQKLLQTMSYKIYNEKVAEEQTISEIWSFLENPALPVDFDVKNLSYFNVPNEWVMKKRNTLKKEFGSIRQALEGRNLENKKVKCSQYLPTLCSTNNDKSDFLAWLENYEKAFLM
ncbi:MAG: hypothetical protein K0Q77_3145 [Anaerosporomusa subterranea]|jgi:hypothetical protein|nr:hypothetical protein [Anaerosporomusa subterranea]